MVDLLSEDTAHDRASVLERHGGVVRDRGQERALVGREVSVAVANELADLAALPAQRNPHRKRAGPSLGPSDTAVLEHEGGSSGADRVHRRPDDRFERLLEIKRLGNRLRDPGQRFELAYATLRVR